MAKGGWRIGAGRPGYRVKAEDSLALDIRWLKRNNVLIAGDTRTVTWHRNRKQIISRQIRAKDNAIVVANGNQTQWIRLTKTPCQLGGNRDWFLCPSCDQRMAILYQRANRFACRHCQQISYQSQALSPDDRLAQQFHKKETALLNSRNQRGFQKKLDAFMAVADHFDLMIERYNLCIAAVS